MASSIDKKILMLGSGMVVSPCLEYLARNPVNYFTVACRTQASAENLAACFPRTTAIVLDVASEAALEKHVAAHDLVISLIPYIHHVSVIKAAIKGGTQVVTTSYISDAMRQLDDQAKQAGITVLNEVSIDPGIDHLYAIKKIEEVHAKGGKVLEFYSYCGGLPAPDCADNPLGFRFSWSPRGALLSQRNSARFPKNGEVQEISSENLMSTAAPYYVMDGYDFVAYPNRDSVPFQNFYRIPEAHTVIRCSLRYKGNPAFVQALARLDWLEQEKKEWLKDGLTWAEIQKIAITASGTDECSLISCIKEMALFTDEAESERIITGMKWIRILSSEKATIVEDNLLDTLCARLEKLMSFGSGERDLVRLQHKFVVEWSDGNPVFGTHIFTVFALANCTCRKPSHLPLSSSGDPDRYSGMALSVGVTCGIATQLLLDEHPALNKPGVLAPYTKDICDPIRDLLEKEGVVMVEQQAA